MIDNNDNFLEKYCKTIKSYNVNNLTNLLAKYNNFHNNIKVINVVGTNGKGSTTNYIADQFIDQNKKVGIFISPTFYFQNERVQINHIPISDNKIQEYISFFQDDLIKEEFQLTFFELWTLFAIKYFSDEKVDIAIIEAGLGGKLDSTKIFQNQMAICLTSISKDHIEILGNKIKDIIDQKVKIRWNNETPIFSSSSNLKYQKILKKYKNIYISQKYKKAINIFQIDNVGNVINLFKYFKLKINYELFQKNPLIGRFTIIKKDPYLIFDGAHNIDAIQKLVNVIKTKNIIKPLIIYSSSSDKDYNKILSILSNNFNKENIFVTSFENKRSVDINVNILSEYNKFDFNNIILLLNKNKDRNIIFTGSLYFISEAFLFLEKNNFIKK